MPTTPAARATRRVRRRPPRKPHRTRGGDRLDLGGRAVGDDPTGAHDDDAVGEGVGLVEVVRREDDRAARVGELAHGGPEGVPASTSIAAVGSSSTSRSGSDTTATAKRARCSWPPESLFTRRPAISVQRARRRAASTGIGRRCAAATSATASRTVVSGSSAPPWSIAPTRPETTAVRGSAPKSSAWPSVGVERPSARSTVVVLPAPFGPRRATTSPGRIVRSTPSTATTAPKRLRRPLSWMTVCRSWVHLRVPLRAGPRPDVTIPA